MATAFITGLIVSGFIGWLAARLFTRYALTTLVNKKDSFAGTIAGLAAQYINPAELTGKLSDAGLLDDAMPTIEKHIDEFLEVKLKEEIPMIGMFIGNKTTDKLKEVFIRQLRTLFPGIMQQMGTKISTSLDLEQLVREKLNAIPDAGFKKLLQQPLQKPFTLLQTGGLVTGLLIGLINFLLYYYL